MRAPSRKQVEVASMLRSVGMRSEAQEVLRTDVRARCRRAGFRVKALLPLPAKRRLLRNVLLLREQIRVVEQTLLAAEPVVGGGDR